MRAKSDDRSCPRGIIFLTIVLISVGRIAAANKPEISSLVPACGLVGSAGFTLTVSGANFRTDSVVRWNGSGRPTHFASATLLKADVGSTDLATAGAAQITVYNPPPQGGTSSPVTYAIQAEPACPAVRSISPISGQAKGPGFTLTLSGVQFAAGAVVRWNGADRSTTFLASTAVEATIPCSDIGSPGTAQVAVVNPAPGGSSNALPFRIDPSCEPDACTPATVCPPQGDPGSCACEIIPGCQVENVYRPELGDLQLTVDCKPPLGGPPEAAVLVKNLSSAYTYKVQARFQVVCPTDTGTPPSCMCPAGYDDWGDPADFSCSDYSGPGCASVAASSTSYPRQLVNPFGATCQQVGDWVTCTKVLGLNGTSNDSLAQSVHLLNNCCDCDRVRRSIACAEVEAIERTPAAGGPPETLTDLRYDVMGECRSASWLHRDVLNVPFTCFAPLSISCPAASANVWARPPRKSYESGDFFIIGPQGDVSGLECRLDPQGQPTSDPFVPCATLFPNPANPVPPLRLADLGLGLGSHKLEVRDSNAAEPTVDTYQWEIVDVAQPGDVDFRLLKTIVGGGRTNLVALPASNVFQGPGGPEQLCQALGLSDSATVSQLNPSTGQEASHNCGRPSGFAFTELLGVKVIERDPTTRQGFLAGSEGGNPPITITDDGPGDQGDNWFPVAYHTTARTPQDLCVQCGLTSQPAQFPAEVYRFDAASGAVLAHVCGQIPQWNLVVGEAVLIREPQGPRQCTLATY